MEHTDENNNIENVQLQIRTMELTEENKNIENVLDDVPSEPAGFGKGSRHSQNFQEHCRTHTQSAFPEFPRTKCFPNFFTRIPAKVQRIAAQENGRKKGKEEREEEGEKNGRE
ncbi:hypothetical protein H6P81_019750 [Aristolochia fimbriata]|uniref:Uncharacterized protein n=1 Tax=Aristolochia fimbriata TaxID=158543 RepID=A0AAV7DUE7_ARIFI|nr:hypothetical protein H6P81_019750 [Aristolochia fimbriata]